VSELSRIRTVVVDDEQLFSLWDGVRTLGYASTGAYGKSHRRIPREMKRRIPWSLFGEEGPRARTMTTAVTKDGLKRLVANSRRAAAVSLAHELNMEVVCVPTPEAEVLRIVIAALKPVTVHEEYRVGDYTVDAYIPALRLVVERDRLNDLSRDRNAEWWRRVLIEDRLGCKYLAFDPTRRDFNVGALVNEILHTDLPEEAEQPA
jgi:very-short-patch-repair endonuclease